jgi:hypothetical protein
MTKGEKTEKRQQKRLMRRRVTNVAAAVLAAGVVLGSPGYASASERPGEDQHRGGMGSMMSGAMNDTPMMG